MNEEYTCTELPEKLYARILRDFFSIDEQHPDFAVWFAKTYELYIVNELPLKIDGTQVGILRDVLCSDKPINKVFVDYLKDSKDIVSSASDRGFVSFHLSDQDDDVKQLLEEHFQKHAILSGVDLIASTIDKCMEDKDIYTMLTEVDGWTPSPNPQNSVKRWKRKKKYF